MQSVLTIVLIVVFISACLAAGWYGRYTLREGERRLYDEPWLDNPSVHSVLLSAAKTGYYRKKYIALLVAAISFVLLVLVQGIGRFGSAGLY